MKKKTRTSTYGWWLGIAIVIFFALRFFQVWRFEFPFVFDMGRDHLWVRNMVELKKPTLIGPWGSLGGIYFGPAWYYFLSIPYLLSEGDPRASVIAVMVINALTLIVGSLFLKKEISPKAGFLFAFVWALSPHNINITTYPFHANLLPITSLAMLIAMYRMLQGENRYVWVAALATSLNFHFEPATGVFTTLTLTAFLIWQRAKVSLKSLSLLVMSFVIPFLPQVVFELRHQFIQSKSLLLYFQGQNQTLEGKLPFFIRLGERLRKFTELFSAATLPSAPLLVSGLVLAGIVLYLWRVKKTNDESRLFSLLLFTLLLPLIGFMFLFPPELKGWYLYGFSVSYFILVALFLNRFLSHKTIGYWLLAIGYFIWLGQLHNRLPNLLQSGPDAPELLKTQLNVVNLVYQKAEGKPFSVYVYTPPIYDYHYQYLWWWYSRKENLPLPIEYSYLPGEVSYHPEKQKFGSFSQEKPERVFLVIEPESDEFRLRGWLGHFAGYEQLEIEKLTSGMRLETRLPLSKVQ